MSLADELLRLQKLRDAGTLTAEEFTRAKAARIDAHSRGADTIGDAARTWVRFQIVAGIAGAVFAAFFFLLV